MKQAKNPVQAVQRSIDILTALREQEPMGVTGLATEVELTKGTIHSHLSTLEQNDLVVKEGGQYRLGLRFIDFAHHVTNRVEIYDIVQDEIDALAAQSKELVVFTVEEHGEGVCLYKAEGENAVQTELYVGLREGLYHTAVGKSILAFLPKDRREQIIEQIEFEQLTANTITDPAALRAELETVREQNIAFSHEETIPGLVGVGAPIRHQDGTVHGGLSIIGPKSRMTEERLHGELTDMIHNTMTIIEINITSVA